jgi:hypothetical protein
MLERWVEKIFTTKSTKDTTTGFRDWGLGSGGTR